MLRAGVTTVEVAGFGEARPSPRVYEAVVVDCAGNPRKGFDEVERLQGADAPILALIADEAEFGEAALAGANEYVRIGLAVRDLATRLKAMIGWRLDRDVLLSQRRDLQALLDLTRDFASAIDVTELLHDLVKRLAGELGVIRCSIVLADGAAGDKATIVAASDSAVRTGIPLELARYPEIREVLRTGRPLLVASAPESPLLEGEKDKIARAGVAALAAFPLSVGGVTTGALLLRAGPDRGAFSSRETHFGTTVANAIALALRNARLVEKLKDESEERRRAMAEYVDLFEHTLEGVAVTDPEGKILILNLVAGAIFDTDSKGERYTKLADFIAPRDREKVEEIIEAVRQKRSVRDLDIAIVSRLGKEKLLSLAAGPLAGGECVLSFRDVTLARQVEGELRRTKDFLEKLIDATPDAVIAADMKGKIILFNKSAERVSKYTADEVVGKMSVSRIYPEGQAFEVMRELRGGNFGEKGRLDAVRKEIVAKDGEVVPVMLSAAIITDSAQEIASVGIFTDLRERLRIERKLSHTEEKLQQRERQAMIAELAGTAAHELNQPLTSVMGYAEMLRRKLPETDPSWRGVNIIFQEAERMAEIVRKIGKITRYETKAYVGKVRIVDLEKSTEGE